MLYWTNLFKYKKQTISFKEKHGLFKSKIRSDIVIYDLLSLFRFWCQIVRVKHQDALGILLREPYVMLMKSNYGCQACNLASLISRLT